MNHFRNGILGVPVEEQLLGRKRPRNRGTTALSDVAVTRQETRRVDSRAGDRHRLPAQPVTLVYKRKKYAAELINLSGGGAMVESDIEPRLWERVDVDFGETGRLEAAVRWVKDRRIGLEFAHETQLDCSPQDREALLCEVIERNFPDAVALAPVPETAEAAAKGASDASRRTSVRHPLIWTASVTFNNHTAPVRIRNISATGALVQSDLSLAAGVMLLLDLGAAGSIAATVQWALGDKAGLLFEGPFDVQRLAASPPKVATPDWVRPDYLRDAGSEPSDRHWDHASVEELASSLEAFRKS